MEETEMTTNETVRDVCAEIRNFDPADEIDIPWTKPELMSFLDRIEDANKREVDHVRQCLTGDCERFKLGAEPCTTCTVYAYEREMAAKDAEVERMIVANNAAIDTMQSRIDEMVEIVSAKDAEIAKHERCYHALEVHCKKLEEEYLRATNALKPVIECRIERIDGVDSPDGEFMTSSEYGVCDADGNEVDNHSIASSLNAVREAQRIMKEGEAK